MSIALREIIICSKYRPVNLVEDKPYSFGAIVGLAFLPRYDPKGIASGQCLCSCGQVESESLLLKSTPTKIFEFISPPFFLTKNGMPHPNVQAFLVWSAL